ncbi:MAG TPA: tRNA uridine-5-carboxymethylaminomethyl(34) synthesis GTPase MnmE [Burkholderiales bacterium]|jgi:tRNA modification GTPase|nr:tRNA uridine-5-carboxymethylaminomethyl(34) synthesis GTPase MnmE [Burkholderiales bacterium]
MVINDTIAAIATPPGRGGIGVVRISGNNLVSGFAPLFQAAPEARHAILTNFIDAAGEVIDRGIVLFFPAPHSYTGEDVLELHGHGGPVVLGQLLRRCLDLGARPAEPGEFTKRAFLNDKIDLAQAEAVADLIDATTVQAARSALRSLRGEFSQAVQQLVTGLVELRALTEAALDFSDEEIDPGAESETQLRLDALRHQLDTVFSAARHGSLLRDGMQVVLAGAPNVGKSSLLNRLAGDELAIVTNVPGTTRDAVRETITIGGVPIHLVDTAGLREAVDPVEKIGVSRSLTSIENADLVLLVADSTEPATADLALLGTAAVTQAPVVRIMNKIDLSGETAGKTAAGGVVEVRLSAKTGDGIELLLEALLEATGAHVDEEAVFMARERHLRALGNASRHLERAALEVGRSELFAEELRLAQLALSSITGEFTADDLLGEIFSRFCIGK